VGVVEERLLAVDCLGTATPLAKLGRAVANRQGVSEAMTAPLRQVVGNWEAVEVLHLATCIMMQVEAEDTLVVVHV